MVYIDTATSVENFRRFLIDSTCLSFMPESYQRDPEVFPEKEGDVGSIYVEAADKVTLKKIRDITFINARDILGIIYVSKSGNSKLKWRQIRGTNGKVTGEASINSLVNLVTARVITSEYVDDLAKGITKTAKPTEDEDELTAEEDEIAVEGELASSNDETLETEDSPQIIDDV
jgi:hypothetical protein